MSIPVTVRHSVRRLVLAALFSALALLLPLLTGGLQSVGNMLCPMHLPVLLCGFFCGPWYALAVGLAAPLLRFALFGLPPLYPVGAAMCVELAAYGFTAGLLYRLLPRRRRYVYLSLCAAMLLGRLVWGFTRTMLALLTPAAAGFSLPVFLASGFVTALPGIALQILLIPPIVMLARKYSYPPHAKP